MDNSQKVITFQNHGLSILKVFSSFSCGFGRGFTRKAAQNQAQKYTENYDKIVVNNLCWFCCSNRIWAHRPYDFS